MKSPLAFLFLTLGASAVLGLATARNAEASERCKYTFINGEMVYVCCNRDGICYRKN